MKTENLDICYCVKDSPWNEELRYSLRSLKNLKGIGKVWIFGGCPSWVNEEEVNVVRVEQDKGNKWENTAGNWIEICKNPEVSENFILMNDDFFVMRRTDTIPYFYDRTLVARRNDFFVKMGYLGYRANKYTRRLLQAEQALLKENLPTKNYELHLPMVFNKQKLGELIEKYNNLGAKRSLYGNTYAENSVQTIDVKIWERDKKWDNKSTFLSTSDRSFADGKVGEQIRNKFKKPSKYEKEAE